MGEGVTNPTDSAVEGPSVLYAACLKLVLLVSVSCVVALRWRKHRRESTNSDATSKDDNTVGLRGGNPSTSLTGSTGPHLRRSEHCGIVSQLRPLANVMEQNTDAPSEPPPDSFFTWDTGGSSGDYSFVHTAVELPKYPDGAITEEERQMLLLYMQSGHPELLLSATNSSMDSTHSLLGAPPPTDSVMCDQTTVRGFLETIVEENSDDLRSPSDGDEASVGWGSWDESDDDRDTVVEMETNDQMVHCGIKRELDEQNISVPKATKREKPAFIPGYNNFPENSARQNVIYAVENQLDDCQLADKQLISLSGATSVNNCAFENSGAGIVSFTGNNIAELCEVSVKTQNDIAMDTNREVSEYSDFESLWITANNIDNSHGETVNPWCKNECNFTPVLSDAHSVKFSCNNHDESTDGSSLLTLSSQNLCLVPSGTSNDIAHDTEEKLMFSDDFKDYFLPTDRHIPAFNTNADDNVQDMLVSENLTTDSKVRCFRIGFESEPLEIVNDEYYDSEDKLAPVSSESNICENSDFQQETLFSPRDGDVVYGSSWLGGHSTKKPEKTHSAEARFSTMQSESPPLDNNRKSLHLSDQSGSDDELQQVPNSLSRWQHHTDLQHVQEATSPLTRWQHQSNLQRKSDEEGFPKQNNYSDESDDGLPPQLKQIYSSFKMKDNKMGRIRIKEDKNNNFKKLGLWDNEKKVTLPPFITTNTQSECSNSTSVKDTVRGEELDDLELDMFSVNKNKFDKSDPLCNVADPDIDDALKSFNHLDDYSSNTDENSESENSYTVNTVGNIEHDNEDLSTPSTPDMSSLKSDAFSSCTNEHLKLENENICSDNSDNCPLCTDPSFKNSKINDIFSNPNEETFLDNNVQSLLLNTFPKIKSLVQEDSVPETNGAESSISPLTSSDSDEGIRTANMKKRIKRRLKDNSNVELKHDDSGYVEDDEDDDEDSLEEKDTKDPVKVLSNISSNKDSSNKIRKSLSSVFYESKSMNDLVTNGEAVPKSFEEFSSQLQQSSLSEDVTDGIINKEKWNIPDNLSQFSAWLLDKELKKISSRDEMEKLIVNDIISLREQTIAQFLKTSTVEEKCAHLPSTVQDDSNKSFDSAQLLEDNSSDMKLLLSTEPNLYPEVAEKESLANVNKLNEVSDENSDSDKTYCDEHSEDKLEHSSEELDSEYYNYNFNSKVSKILANSNPIILNNSETENDSMPSSKLSDAISDAPDVLKSITENEADGISCEENTLSYFEIDNKHGEMQNANADTATSCFNKSLNFDNLIIQTGTDAETSVDEKQEQSPERQRDVVDTESEKRVKVISTTTFVTSDEKPATNIVEGNDSTTDSSAINNDKLTSHNREVAPSVEHTSNYKIPEEISLEGRKLEVSEDSDSFSNDLVPDIESENNNLNFENILFDPKGEISDKLLLSGDEITTFSIDCQAESSFSKVRVSENINVINTTNETSVSDLLSASDNIPAPVEFGSPIQGVAPSSDGATSEIAATPGNEIDLMISDTREAKGAYQGFSNDIISLEARAASKEVDSVKHVTDVDCHAYDELSSVTRPVVNDNSYAISALSDGLSDKVIAKIVPEGLQKKVALLPDVPVELVDSEDITTAPYLSVSEEIPGIKCEKFPEQVSECIYDYKISSNDLLNENYSSKNRENSQVVNLYKSKSVIVLQTEDIEDDEEQRFLDNAVELKFKNSDNARNLNGSSDKDFRRVSPILASENSDKKLSKIQSSDDLSLVTKKENLRDNREEYKRSRSVGRENKEEKDPFETWSGQSKSTPDLSRCHDQQLNSSVPLSALLSKSVSQRIQDYLGKSTRGGVLSRSLPPNERSRHYRRICVSTETVVERAARFEARSKSNGRESSGEPVSSRSGSCPPLNMRTNDLLKGVRCYSKPTATVRPTVDIYRSSREYNHDAMVHGGKKTEEELFELITGYSTASKVTHKPPVPPQSSQIQQSLKACRLKGKIASARKEFFEKLSQQDLRPRADSKQPLDIDIEDDSGTCGLRRFNEFRKSAREERARLAQSHPDLGALEAAVRSSRRRIDQLKKRRQKAPALDAGPRPSTDANMPVTTTPTTTKDGTLVLPYRRCTGEIAWASCARRLQEAKTRSESKSQEPLEIVEDRRFKRPAERALLRAHDYENAADEEYDDPGPAIPGSDFSRARSMDFLLDNREGAEPPENRLSQRVKSEHELRIERSLQNLTLPDWYTQSKKPKEGFILRRGSEGSAGESRKRWLGFSSSRTPSATSLTTPPSSYSQRNIIIPKRVTPTSSEWRYIGSLVSSRESLTPASPASLSPRECSSAAFNYGLNASLSRWSSSRLSTSSAPLTAASVHRSFRQPYLGWRAAAASSGGASRSSPGVSPINATTPLQGSRPGSPRRGSQDHQYGYGLQQNQITSAATLRPEGCDTGDSGSRISPLALYDNSTNVFFNSNIEVPEFSTPEMRRDRYSYTQSLYSGTVIVSPGTEFKPVPSIAEDTPSTTDDRFSMSKSPQPPPRIWMESSFVGSKKDGKDQVQYPQGRTIRIVPSDSVRSGDRVGGSSVRSSCAPQTTMGEYVLRDFRRFGITL